MAAERDNKGRYTKRAPKPMADKAYIFIELDRTTGQIVVDEEFSTPLETYGMLMRACQDREDKLTGRDSD